ncbi:MAG: AAA-like domain-containing protein [Desulfamplus sp.]|nr:AAA-like domain-containing protein [Desulfamplus sp.]
MRTFSSYGPVDIEINYYAPRKELLDFGYRQLVGPNPEKGGHYITVWGSRQTGKSWALREILFRLKKDEKYHVLKINLENLKQTKDVCIILEHLSESIGSGLNKTIPVVNTPEKFQNIFSCKVLDKPLVLILDEFDALNEDAISAIVSTFRNIYTIRQDQSDRPTDKKDYLLHAVALIGVRSVLGVESAKGSPFNVQRSMQIPSLTFDEVETMFRWHEQESGQRVDQEVIDTLFYEIQGQPGLTCWFGELLTQGWGQFRVTPAMPMDMALFERAYRAGLYRLPNNNILNIISKVKVTPYKEIVLRLLGTREKVAFAYDKIDLNFLYTNGVIDIEEIDDHNQKELYAKFACPFVQKRLFNFLTDELFDIGDELYEPFEDIESAINETRIDVRQMMKFYQKYLIKNSHWILERAPRRSDLRIFEAVFHFNVYMYLSRFIRRYGGEVYPEFPTGNGQIDLVLKYAEKTYGVELKSYIDRAEYRKALKQSAAYGQQLGLKEISLIFFIEYIDADNKIKFETDFNDPDTGVKVRPVFVETKSLNDL